MLELKQITPLQLKVQSSADTKLGPGRHGGLEIIPNTPTARQRLGVSLYTEPRPALTELKPEVLKDLREYQIEDVKFLASRKVGANLSEPRTGKTPTIIKTLMQRELTKCLIVCPASAVYQWQSEYIKWKNEPCIVMPKIASKRKEAYMNWTHGLILSYELLRIDINIIKNIPDIEAIVLDESHRIKNHKAQTTEAAFKLIHIPNRYALTGTLSPNKLEEVYSTLHFLFPTIFTSYWRFIEYYFNYEEVHNWKTNIDYTNILGLKRKDELIEFIDAIAIRHTRKEVMPWLPEKDYIKVKLDLNRDQQRYIQEMNEFFETEDLIADSVLTRLTYLRQICNAPECVGLKGGSPKIEWLTQFIKDYPDKPILVFSNSTKLINIISDKLKIKAKIIGETSKEQRDTYRTQFQNGKIHQLLINIKAGKEALTLDRAEVAIFLDAYPPYGDVEQAENRFTATTLARADKEHTIMQVMMKDSIDEQIFDLVAKRGEVVDIINNYKKYLKGGDYLG